MVITREMYMGYVDCMKNGDSEVQFALSIGYKLYESPVAFGLHEDMMHWDGLYLTDEEYIKLWGIEYESVISERPFPEYRDPVWQKENQEEYQALKEEFTN